MAWRLITIGADRWAVTPAAERHPDTGSWHLALSFKPADLRGRSVWAACPIESASKAALYAQAEQLSDGDLTALLTERLSQVVT